MISVSSNRGKYNRANAIKSSWVVMFCGTNCGPSFALFFGKLVQSTLVAAKIILTPASMFKPFTFFEGNCALGLCRTNFPSVTGRKAQVPNLPDEDTLTFAACSSVVLVF